MKTLQDRYWEELNQRQEKMLSLRDKMFECVLDGQNFLRGVGAISKHDYWKWRLDFDLKRYNITP